MSWNLPFPDPEKYPDLFGDDDMPTLTEPPVWPLPAGHFFGPVALEESNAACHSGKKEWLDNNKLQLWQRHYSEVWDRELEVSGHYDAGTQDAVEVVQEAAGWEPSGKLDENTWKVVWTAKPGAKKKEKKESPPEKKKPTTRSAFKKSMGG